MYNRKNRLLNKIAGMALPTNRMKTEARKKKLRASYHLHVKAKFILMAINLVVVWGFSANGPAGGRPHKTTYLAIIQKVFAREAHVFCSSARESRQAKYNTRNQKAVKII